MVRKHSGYFRSEDFFFVTTLFNIYCMLWFAAREHILSNLQNHPAPQPAPELQQQNAPVAEVRPACLTDSKAAADLIQSDLSILQEQARCMSKRSTEHTVYLYIHRNVSIGMFFS